MFAFKELKETPPHESASTSYQGGSEQGPAQPANSDVSQQEQPSNNPFKTVPGAFREAFLSARASIGRNGGEEPPATALGQTGASYQNQPPPPLQPQQSQAQQQQFAVGDEISPFLKHSFRLGSVQGIPINIHYTFLILCFLATLSGYPNGTWMWMDFLIYGPILFITVLFHELGHCWAAVRTGSPVHGILFWPLGGLAFVGHSTTLEADLQIATSGPVMHLPMLLFWFVLRLAVNGGHASWKYSGHFVADLCYAAMVLNVVLMLFNLLIPAFPLDGGRILIDVLLLMGVSKEGAAKTSIALSSLVAFVLVAIGLMSGLSGLTEMFIGAWIAYQAYMLYQHLVKGTIDVHPLFSLPSRSANQQTPPGGTVRNPLAQV